MIDNNLVIEDGTAYKLCAFDYLQSRWKRNAKVASYNVSWFNENVIMFVHNGTSK
jgi:hypothetical protein